MKAPDEQIKKLGLEPNHYHLLTPKSRVGKTIYLDCSDCKNQIQLSKKEIIKKWGKPGWIQMLKIILKEEAKT